MIVTELHQAMLEEFANDFGPVACRLRAAAKEYAQAVKKHGRGKGKAAEAYQRLFGLTSVVHQKLREWEPFGCRLQDLIDPNDAPAGFALLAAANALHALDGCGPEVEREAHHLLDLFRRTAEMMA